MAFDLTIDQINSFDNDGYLLLRNWIPDELVLRLQSTTNEIIGLELTRFQKGGMPAHVAIVKRDGKTFITRINDLFLDSNPVFFELLGFPGIDDIAGALAGKECISTYESLVIKNKGDDQAIGWHRDMAHNRKGRVFTIGIYLDKSRKGRGALNVIPGSQSSSEELCIIEDDLKLGKLNSIEIEMEPGDVLIHDVMVAHSSQPVTDQDFRRVIYFEFRSIKQARTNQGFSEEWIGLRYQLSKLAQQRWQEIQTGNVDFEQNEYSFEEKELIEKLYSIQAQIEPGHYCFQSH